MYLIFFVVLLTTFFYSISKKSKRHLHMLQQNLYNENNRYVKWLIKNNKSFFTLELITLLFSMVGLFVIYDLEFVAIISLIVLILMNILIGKKWNKIIINDQNKKKLVITARVKRLITTTFILHLLPLLLFMTGINDINKIIWAIVLIESIMLFANSCVVLIAMFINMPIEKMVYIYYKTKAQNKLKQMNNLKIIGITGSYGKTSSKNILSDILNIKYNALPTPRNLNTYNGLIMTVNNYMDKFNDIFIAEMGAYVKGEIRGLCKLVKPKYGILTTIGTAHLESFGSEENIVQGKFELIESLPEDGFAILNGDDEKQINYKLKNKVKTIWIGIDNKEADYRATNIKCSDKGTDFDCIVKETGKKYHFQTKLLGKHNVYNILAGIACGREFNIEFDDLALGVKNVTPVEHRLELKKMGNFFQIDDAYNSNPVGAKNACEILGMMPGMKIVVTPGMIELGDKEDEYNKKFGEQIAEVADLVILIGEKQTRAIKEGLIEKKYDSKKIMVLNDVRKAYPIISEYANKKEVYALFENDLPDTYNEK